MAKKTESRVSVAHSNMPFGLGLAGGIFTVLISILSIALTLDDVDATLLVMSIIGILSGGLVIYGASLLKIEGKFKAGSLTMIISSIVGLLSLQGLIVGPVLSLAAGILTHVRKMI